VVFAKLKDFNHNEFESTEVVFHMPSEHRIDGKEFDMEV
jgi:carbonic anhydrase